MRIRIPAAALAVAAAAVLGGLAMAEERKGIGAGSAAPEFRLNDHTGKAVRLADFRERKWVVLAWFPKAMTPG